MRVRTLAALVVVTALGACAVLWFRSNTREGSPSPAKAPGGSADAPVALASAVASSVASSMAPDAGRSALPASEPSARPDDAVPRSALSGRVLDEQGAPLAGADVTLRSRPLATLALPADTRAVLAVNLAEAKSGADGTFRLALPASARVDVHAAHEGFAPAVARRCSAADTIELVLTRGRLVHGRVTRARDGAPIAGATIRVAPLDPRHGEPRTATSAADGAYSLRVAFPAGSLGVTAKREQSSYQLPVEFDAQGECVLDVALEDGALVEGRVLDRDTGLPIAGARVEEGRSARRTVVTDARGEYRLAGYGNPDVAILRAVAPGYGTALAVPGAPVDGRTRADFALTRGRRARGRVVALDGAPLAGVFVAAVARAGADADWRTSATDAGGAFALDDLAPELGHCLLLAAPEHATELHDFPAGEEAHAELDLGTFTLDLAQALHGRVLDADGTPHDGAVVALRGWNADRAAHDPADEADASALDVREQTSDAAGRFEFADLAPGEYALWARAAERTATQEQTVQLGSADVESIELRFAAGAGIRGRAVDEQGRPLAGLRVTLEVERTDDPAAAESVNAWAKTGADGAFALEGLPPGSYALELFPTHFAPEDLHAPLLAARVEHVAPGGAELTVTLARGLTIEGVLVDAHGAALGDHSVRARDARGEVGWTAWSDPEGRFAMPVARDTRWTLEVLAPEQTEGAPLAVKSDVAAGTLDVRIALP